MKKGILSLVTLSHQLEWVPLTENGIETKGIFVKVLRYDDHAMRAPTILLKFEPGAGYPYHNHPGGEELFVLEGDAIIENVKLTEGDYLYTPPGYKHSVRTENGCVLLFIIPEEVEIVK